MGSVNVQIHYRIECKDPDSTGGLTDWHYVTTPMSFEAGIERLDRERARAEGTRKEFRLLTRTSSTTFTDWDTIDAPR